MSIFDEGMSVWISKLIITKAGSWVAKTFVALGIGFGTYALLFQPILDWAITKWSAMPSSIAAWLSALGIDVAISIILSAYGFKHTNRLILQRRPQA